MTAFLVTGGAGFIGSHFVRVALAKTSARVVVLDKLTYAGNLRTLEDVAADSRVHIVQDDICDRRAVGEIFRVHKPTAVINFAAESHVDRSIDGPRAFVESNVLGAFELLEASRAHLEGLSESERNSFRFLQVSTDEVYGSLGETGLFTETTPYDPRSPYAASKAAADHLVSSYAATFGFAGLITNCSNNYGPYQYPEKLIPLTISKAVEGEPLPIYGDGSNVRDWLHVTDHCEGILLALQKGTIGEKYNLGGSNERTNLEVVDGICSALDALRPAAKDAHLAERGIKSYTELKTFVADRPGHDKRYAIDATKSRGELGWQPSYRFEDGLKETVRWYLENTEWCEHVLKGKYEKERLGLAAER